MTSYYIYEGKSFHRITWNLSPFIEDLKRQYTQVTIHAGNGNIYAIIKTNKEVYTVYTQYKGDKL